VPATTTPRRTDTWTADAVRGLGVKTDIVTAAAVLGLGRSGAYDLHREGRFPCPVVQVGRNLIVPTAGLLRVLGLDAAEPPGAA